MRTSSVAATVLGVAALGLLSGCTRAAAAPAASPAGPAKDGTYSATGDYITPDGPESVHVTLAVASGIVRSVHVTASGTTPTAQYYQTAFESGISGVVVGRKLAGLTVGAVSGSSLTSQGFDQALDAIRAEAAK